MTGEYSTDWNFSTSQTLTAALVGPKKTNRIIYGEVARFQDVMEQLDPDSQEAHLTAHDPITGETDQYENPAPQWDRLFSDLNIREVELSYDLGDSEARLRYDANDLSAPFSMHISGDNVKEHLEHHTDHDLSPTSPY
jgi:hypothetical protein